MYFEHTSNPTFFTDDIYDMVNSTSNEELIEKLLQPTSFYNPNLLTVAQPSDLMFAPNTHMSLYDHLPYSNMNELSNIPYGGYQAIGDFPNSQRFGDFMKVVVDLSNQHNVSLEYLESVYGLFNTPTPTMTTTPSPPAITAESLPAQSSPERCFSGKTCQACKNAHSGCDKMRPCSRCIRIQGCCVDSITKKRGRPPLSKK